MKRSRLIRLCLSLFCLLLALPAWAANLDKLARKLPEEDRVLYQALKIFMTADEQEVFLTTFRTHEERVQFFKDTGYYNKWDQLEPTQQDAIRQGKVIPGMDRDALWMTWGKAYKIRKDVDDESYVDVYYYRWERDKKGREFLSTIDSTTAYKNTSFDRLVYMFDGIVVDVLDEGDDRKPNRTLKVRPKTSTPLPPPSPQPAATPAGADAP